MTGRRPSTSGAGQAGPDLQAAVSAARGVLDRLRLPDGTLELPVDVERAARACGLRVAVAPAGVTGQVVRNLTGVPVSGVLDFTTGRIYVDGREAAHRRRFTIAHEIAHEVLGHERLLGGGTHVVWAEDATEGDGAAPGPERPAVELEADAFAAELLVPARVLAAEVEAVGASVPLLARRFDVSCAAMRLQLGAWLPVLQEQA